MMVDKKGPATSTEIPTSSMADIAFLLLVFFIVTTSMNQDQGIGMTLPPPGDPMPIPRENIASVWINNQGQIAFKAMGMDYQTVTLSQLRSQMDERIHQNPNLVVSILAQEQANYRTFIQVLDVLRIAGAQHNWSRISIAQPYGRGGGG